MTPTGDTEAQLMALVPHEYRWRIDVHADTGCWRAVRGGRSGCGARYPATSAGRLLHRVLWETEHGPTSLLLVHTCRDRLCVRPDHLREMNWAEMHSFHRGSWANRSPSRPVQANTGLTPHPHSSETVSGRYEASRANGRMADRP